MILWLNSDIDFQNPWLLTTALLHKDSLLQRPLGFNKWGKLAQNCEGNEEEAMNDIQAIGHHTKFVIAGLVPSLSKSFIIDREIFSFQ